MLKSFKHIILLLLMTTLNCFAQDSLKIETWEDAVLWMGGGMPVTFDPSTVKDKENAIRLALKECEKLANENDELAMNLLACYYYHFGNNTRKGLFWAHKSAECGSSDAMLILWEAYGNGNGVVKDVEECAKWLYLAAAAGEEKAKERIEQIEKEDPNSLYTVRVRKLAIEWQKAHPKAFFSAE